MKRVLITGVNGFVGKHLVRELKGRGCQVVGLGFHEPVHPLIQNNVEEYFDCDLNDKEAVAKLPLNSIDGVINLAGLAQVGDSFNNPELYMRVNVDVLINIGQALLDNKSAARIVAVSTGAVYDSNQSMPLTESSNLLDDGSPYALSKIAMEKAASQLSENGLECIVARPFNHIGPGQAPGFLLPDLFNKLLAAKDSGQPIKVGDLKTKRDYTDVRDVVRAYADLVLADRLSFDLFNICSGKSIAGQVILDTLLKAMDLKDKIEIVEDPALLRPNDPKNLFGSNQRLHDDTGWQPKIEIDQTIKDIVEQT